MSALPLTPKQERVWRYLKACERSPTYREMASALGFKSCGQLKTAVDTLREKGFITYTAGRARSIVAVDPRRDLASFSTRDLAAELARRLAS